MFDILQKKMGDGITRQWTSSINAKFLGGKKKLGCCLDWGGGKIRKVYTVFNHFAKADFDTTKFYVNLRKETMVSLKYTNGWALKSW